MAETPVGTPAGTPGAAEGAPGIDVQRLADKVYDLLLADTRLARARGDASLEIGARRSGEAD